MMNRYEILEEIARYQPDVLNEAEKVKLQLTKYLYPKRKTNMNLLDLKQMLMDEGASLAGFADIGNLYDDTACCGFLRYPKGVSIAIAIPRDVILSIKEKPTRTYFDAYHSINDKLNQLATKCETLLQKEGFAAYAQTTGRVHETESYHTPMPHKTVAVNAGLGWIGKCALLITEQYGSAIRLTSVLTDAPLPADDPVVQSKCGACNACSETCPAHAVTGILWEPGMERERLFHASECRAKARAIAMDVLHEKITLCGKCIEICPYTRKYLSVSNEKDRSQSKN